MGAAVVAAPSDGTMRHGTEARQQLVPQASQRADLSNLLDEATRRFGSNMGPGTSAAVSLLNASGMGTLEVSRTLLDTLRDNLRLALPSMSKTEVAGLLRSLVTTTPISPPLQPLFRELVKALEWPADRVHLAVLGEPLAAYNVPAEAIFELPHATRAAVWAAAPTRFNVDLAATAALLERDVASLAPLHALTMRIGTHPPAPPPPAVGLQAGAGPGAAAAAAAATAAAAAAFAAAGAGPARRRLAVTAELVACVRGDARRYEELTRHITGAFTASRDGRWAQLRSDVYVAHFQATAPQQGLPRDPCGQLILEREELLRGKAAAAAAMLRTIRGMIALAAEIGRAHV